MSEKKLPASHGGHWIGPAPTSEELGLNRKSKENSGDKANSDRSDEQDQQEGDPAVQDKTST
jgi:hypothetical protein